MITFDSLQIKMPWTIFILTAVIAILAYPDRAQASHQCLFLFNQEKSRIEYSIDPAFTPRQTSLIRGVIERLKKLSAEVRIPNPDVGKRSENVFKSGYQALANKIWMGMASHNYYLRKAIAVLAHEFGHAIFDLNIYYLFQGQKVNGLEGAKIVDSMRKKIESSEEYKTAVAEMNEKFKGFTMDRRNRETESIFRRLGGDAYYKLLKQGDDLVQIVMAHNELFSDMIAVMLIRDGNAVSNVFHNPHPDAIEDLSRSFLQRTSVEHFEVQSIGETKYELLNPTRSHIWYRYLETLTPELYPKFIKAYLSATQIHLDSMLASGEPIGDLAWSPRAEERNRAFIKILDLEFTRLGISQSPN